MVYNDSLCLELSKNSIFTDSVAWHKCLSTKIFLILSLFFDLNYFIKRSSKFLIDNKLNISCNNTTIFNFNEDVYELWKKTSIKYKLTI